MEFSIKEASVNELIANKHNNKHFDGKVCFPVVRYCGFEGFSSIFILLFYSVTQLNLMEIFFHAIKITNGKLN